VTTTWAWCMNRSTPADAIVVWEQFVEPAGVDVARDRDRAAFLGGVDHAEQRFGCLGRDREQAQVVNDDQVGL
jgi:hypothetical protein